MVKDLRDYFDQILAHLSAIVPDQKVAYAVMEYMMDTFANWEEFKQHFENDAVEDNPFFKRLEYSLGRDAMGELSTLVQEEFMIWSYRKGFITEHQYHDWKSAFY